MKDVIKWLIDGDICIQFQTWRDLKNNYRPDLQFRIENEGWGRKFLSYRNPQGHWGRGFYQPKWTSSHYTILDLKNMGISPLQPSIRESIRLILETQKAKDGGINPGKTISVSDVCVNGMFINYATYFKTDEDALKSIVDFILSQHMPDGGFNCLSNRKGARHSSLHSTISVLEGIHEYQVNGYSYRLKELQTAAQAAREFILMHQLFRSDRTSQIIHPDFLRFHFPPRWHYNILRCLDYFRYAEVPYDDRMREALDFIRQKSSNGIWSMSAHYPGKNHFVMENGGKPSRWITLMALRILQFYRHQESGDR